MMFKAALRAATLANRSAIRSTRSQPLRAFSTSSRLSSGAPVPPLYGSGAKPGEVPTDELQATGLERLQLLGEMEGIPAFDSAPLDASRVGTTEDPILVPSLVRHPLVFFFSLRLSGMAGVNCPFF
jgi:cytochrome c oxidase subunit 5b